jgi:hypothetical protein
VGVVEASKGHFYDRGRVSDQFSVEQNKVWKFWFLRTHMMRGNKITGEVEASTGYSHDGGQISGEVLLIRTSCELYDSSRIGWHQNGMQNHEICL